MTRRLAPTPLSERTLSRARAHREASVPAPPVGNTRAVRHGASADGANLPGFSSTVAEVQAAIEVADWLQPTDLIVLDTFCRELHAYRYTDQILAGMTQRAWMKAGNAHKLQTRRAGRIGSLAEQLGLTATARAKLKLNVARTQAVKVEPINTEARALKVAQMLAEAGALPPVDGEAVEDESSPDQLELDVAPTGEVIPINGEVTT